MKLRRHSSPLPLLRIVPLLAVPFLLASLAGCGSVERTLKRAAAAQAIGEYCEAANLYKRAYQRVPAKEREQRGAVAYRMADAYRLYGNTARARSAYSSAVRYNYTDTLTYFYLGEMQRMAGSYKEAAASYEAYLERHPGDAAAAQGLENALKAAGERAKGSSYTVKIENLFNGSRSDYAPALMGAEASELYFSTTRQQVTGSELSGITGMKNGDIYYSRKDEKGKWKVPEPADGVNTADDEGACSFSPDGQTMYLTVCRTDAQYPRMAEIWTSSRSDAKWSKPQPLKITADTLSSYAHPAVSPDGRWLYFTSDMPGGYGGMDLWRAAITGAHGLGPVENLGESINTAGNEVFPAFRPNGELYFASDGRTPNFGGLDIYSAQEDTVKHRWAVRHLPAPMNSNADDFGITFEGLHHRGYFSSNRSTGGRGWDKIYSFSYPEILQTVKGWVYEQDGYELPEATVYMIGNDGTNMKFGVRGDGSFEQPLSPGVDYIFLAVCKGFLNYRNELHVDSVEAEVQHVLQFPLPSISVPVLVRNVFYEFDKATLTDDSRGALDRLSALLKENPHVTIELSAHCDYRGNDDYNERLSQRRAESVVRYLTEHGIEAPRLEAKGYGEKQPKVVTKKLAETYGFLKENDVLTEEFILKLTPEQQEVCNALNRRTEFKVLRTTYGLFDEKGNIRVGAVRKSADVPAGK